MVAVETATIGAAAVAVLFPKKIAALPIILLTVTPDPVAETLPIADFVPAAIDPATTFVEVNPAEAMRPTPLAMVALEAATTGAAAAAPIPKKCVVLLIMLPTVTPDPVAETLPIADFIPAATDPATTFVEVNPAEAMRPTPLAMVALEAATTGAAFSKKDAILILKLLLLEFLVCAKSQSLVVVRNWFNILL
jgi:hypothetical protein